MSNDADVYVERSGKAFESGNADQAIAEINQAIRLYEQQPPGPEGNQQLGLCYGARAEARQKKGDFAEAIADYNRALAILPSTPETVDAVATCYMERGACHMMKGHADNNPRLLEAAETDLNYAVNLYERRGVDAPGGIYAKRGIFYAVTGHQQEAKHDLERAQRAGVPVPGDVWAEVNVEQYAALAKVVDAASSVPSVGCLGPTALVTLFLVLMFSSGARTPFWEGAACLVPLGVLAVGVGWGCYEIVRAKRRRDEKLAEVSAQHPGFEEYYRTRQRNSKAQARARLARGALLVGAVETTAKQAKQSYDENFGRK